MVDHLLLIISLLFIISMLTMLSEKLKISYPIFLVIAGLLISLVPGVPRISLEPDLVFIIFLPPLLFSAAWNTSWNDFWFSRRPIGILAFGLVIITACLVAVLAHAMIPDFSLAMGFLLGGIISPPDAVAATSVLMNLKVPRRVVTILEGESLVNDASSLIVFKFAMATIFTGQFILWKAGIDFLLVAAMGIVVGLAIAHIVYAICRFLPTTPSIDTAISLITPFLMYIVAEHFHYSGVLAVVSGGLFLSFRSSDIFTYSSRLQLKGVWSTMIFLMNGLVFILIGLQLRGIVEGLGEYSLRDAILYAVVISIAVIIIRLIWVYPGARIEEIINKRKANPPMDPGWKSVFIVGWSGMRGVVSLASALAVPLTLTNEQAFPHRNLILFITFIVILFTLVIQGLSLPFLVRKLNIQIKENEAEQDMSIRLRLANAVLNYMETEYAEESESVDAFNRLKARYQRMVEIAEKKLLEQESGDSSAAFLPQYRKMLIELVEVRRNELLQIKKDKKYSDELIRNKEYELDLEEARLRRS